MRVKKVSSEAIKPVFNIPDFIKQEPEEVAEELTAEEKILASGGDTGFWKLLKEHINNQLLELDKMNEAAIAQGLPLEEIGRNTIVISQTKGVINKIFHIVEDAKEAVEQSGK